MTTVADMAKAAEKNSKARSTIQDSMEVKDGRLIINVALTPGTPSASGKTKVYFSTHGNVALAGGYKLGVNLYKAN